MNGKHLLFFFPFSLSVGLFLSLAFLRQDVLERPYFKSVSLGCSALAFIAWLFIGSFTLSLDEVLFVWGFCATTLTFGLLLGISKRIATASFFLGILCGIGAIVMDADTMFLSALSPSLFVNDLLSALLLGFAANSCLLLFYHRLQTPFPQAELKRTAQIFLLLLIARFFFSGYHLYEWAGAQDHIWFKTHAQWLVSIRYGVGLGLPMLLSYWLWVRCRRLPDRATRILYLVVTFLILLGEGLGDLLTFLRAIVI